MKRAAAAYLPGHQLQGVLLEGLHLVQPGCDDLLQLFEAVRLEGHPGQTLRTLQQTASCDRFLTPLTAPRAATVSRLRYSDTSPEARLAG